MRPTITTVDSRSNLVEYVDGYAAEVDGRLGVFLGFIEGPDSFDVVYEHRSSLAFESASVIKLPIIHALYRRHQGDLAGLGATQGLKPRNRVGGSGLFHLLADPTPSLRDLARAMIAISDNGATNELIDYLGFGSINETAETIGMTDTQLRRRMMVTLEDNDLGPRRNLPTDGPANTVSPRDCAAFFADVVTEKTLPSEAYEDLRTPFREQKYGDHFTRYFPYDTHVEHKTGWIPSAALDAGIVVKGRATTDRPLVFAGAVDRANHGADGADVLAEIGDATHAWLRQDGAK